MECQCGCKDFTESSYKWNDEIGNFCEVEKRGKSKRWYYIKPLKPLKVIDYDEKDTKEIVQLIFYKRNNAFVDTDNMTFDQVKELAKEMGVYE